MKIYFRANKRDKLPVEYYETAIIAALHHHRVIVVSGATGSGKTTKVPQFILNANNASNIVVTQPRRIAAISVAKRVASELNETVGGTVGYRIRNDQVTSVMTKITYATR